MLPSVNEREVITHKKVEKYDGKNVFLSCIVSTSLEINYDGIQSVIIASEMWTCAC